MQTSLYHLLVSGLEDHLNPSRVLLLMFGTPFEQRVCPPLVTPDASEIGVVIEIDLHLLCGRANHRYEAAEQADSERNRYALGLHSLGIRSKDARAGGPDLKNRTTHK